MWCKRRSCALRYQSGLQGRDALPWLLAIVRNTAFRWLEKKKRDERLEPLGEEAAVPDAGAVDPAAAMVERIDVETLRQAVDALPAEFREVIVLRELEGLSYKEIAAATGASIGTVMSRLSRAAAVAGGDGAGDAKGNGPWNVKRADNLLDAYVDAELDTLQAAGV